MSASASTRCATSAASRSLSPKRISCVATVSFSLMTGTAPNSSSVCSVERPLRYVARRVTSSVVSSTCPIVSPRPWNSSEYADMSCPCPTAAAACACGSSVGRVGMPSWPIPAEMAPEETSNTSLPACRRSASTPTSSVSASWLMPPLVCVIELDPTLTTTRLASRICARTASPSTAGVVGGVCGACSA